MQMEILRQVAAVILMEMLTYNLHKVFLSEQQAPPVQLLLMKHDRTHTELTGSIGDIFFGVVFSIDPIELIWQEV